MLRTPDSISKSDTIISDPVLEPYFITRSPNHEYTVYERVVKGENNNEYLRTVCYPSKFESALRKIMRDKLDFHGTKEFKSLKEYMNKWQSISDEITSIFTM